MVFREPWVLIRVNRSGRFVALPCCRRHCFCKNCSRLPLNFFNPRVQSWAALAAER